MFSTVDSPGMRTVGVWADVAGRGGARRPASSGHGRTPAVSCVPCRALPGRWRWPAAWPRSTLVRRADGNLAAATTSAVPMLVPAGGPSASATGTLGRPSHGPPSRSSRFDRVRVDVTKLSYDGGVVRATLLQSASVAVGLDG